MIWYGCDMMYMIDKVNVTRYDAYIWMTESDRQVTVVLKFSGKDEKLISIVEYRSDAIWLRYMIDMMQYDRIIWYNMMHVIDNMDMSWYDWKCQICMIIVLKVSGKKDRRNPKYVEKLVIIMDYKCEMVSE